MRAQVKKLTDCGFRALYVTSEAECKEALSDGTITHVFLSPETLVSSFSDQLAEVTGDSSGISHVFIDESHCVTQW